MAQVITFVDDLDKTTQGAKTHLIALDDDVVDIDLADPNFQTLRDIITPYLEAGRIRPNRTKPEAKQPTYEKLSPEQMASIREWCARTGNPIPKRGRMPQKIRDAYNEAHTPQAMAQAAAAAAGRETLFSRAK